MLARTAAILILAALSPIGCHGSDGLAKPTEVRGQPASGKNILLIIADDMGKDATFGFAEGTIKPYTPHLDQLASQGLSFTNLWVNPTCAPTRASVLTGRYGFRTGVTRSGNTLPSSETTLQRYIAEETDAGYATALIGKWHLSNSPTFNPESLGIDYYAGVLGPAPESYYDWQMTEGGVSTTSAGYNSEVLTDLAIDWVQSQEKPWFLWLAYNAPHSPFHVPPSEMHSQGALPEFRRGRDATPYYMAAIEAMDYQIGRLLESLPAEERARTTILFIGDNGTPNQVAQPPYGRESVKGSLYQGGINTPLVLSGLGVTRRGTDDNLINGTDLFATVAGLAGVRVTDIHDSRSFLSLLSAEGSHREFVYSEISGRSGDQWTLRDKRYKLIVHSDGREEMFDLLADPYEGNDLLDGTLNPEQLQAKRGLELQLDSIRG